MCKVLRRLFWLALLGGAGYGAYAAWQRKHEPQPNGPPEWPPFDETTDGTQSAAPPVTLGDPPSDAADGAGPVTSFADLGEPGSANGDGASSDRRWVEPVDGECPPGYPIKGNDNSGIYHVPGGRFYARTVPERCYATEADAEADGYRRAKA